MVPEVNGQRQVMWGQGIPEVYCERVLVNWGNMERFQALFAFWLKAKIINTFISTPCRVNTVITADY